MLADVCGDKVQQKSVKGVKQKTFICISDIIMKRCRIILRHAAAADDAKVFCTLLGRNPLNSSDNDDEGFLGSPAMVSRPLDFRTIDLRLATGAYGGSHEAFLEDVREVCFLANVFVRPNLCASSFSLHVWMLIKLLNVVILIVYMSEIDKLEYDQFSALRPEIPSPSAWGPKTHLSKKKKKPDSG